MPNNPWQHPVGLRNNELYKYLAEQYKTTSQFEWTEHELVLKFGYKSFRRCMRKKVLVTPQYGQEPRTVMLSFRLLTHKNATIVHLCSTEPYDLDDLRLKLRGMQMSTNNLERHLAFLSDFGLLRMSPVFGTIFSSLGSSDGKIRPIEFARMFVHAA